jgi:hypothetical protein
MPNWFSFGLGIEETHSLEPILEYRLSLYSTLNFEAESRDTGTPLFELNLTHEKSRNEGKWRLGSRKSGDTYQQGMILDN